MSDEPSYITETREALRSAGWAEPIEAAKHTGRSLAEIATLWERREIQVLEIGGWVVDGLPRVLLMIRLAELEAAPRRPPLQIV